MTIVGKHCESGDVLVRDAQVPADLAVGRHPRHAGHRCLRALDGLQLQQGAAARPWCSWPTARPGEVVRRETDSTTSSATTLAVTSHVRSHARLGPRAARPLHNGVRWLTGPPLRWPPMSDEAVTVGACWVRERRRPPRRS